MSEGKHKYEWTDEQAYRGAVTTDKEFSWNGEKLEITSHTIQKIKKVLDDQVERVKTTIIDKQDHYEVRKLVVETLTPAEVRKAGAIFRQRRDAMKVDLQKFNTAEAELKEWEPHVSEASKVIEAKAEAAKLAAAESMMKLEPGEAESKPSSSP